VNPENSFEEHISENYILYRKVSRADDRKNRISNTPVVQMKMHRNVLKYVWGENILLEAA